MTMLAHRVARRMKSVIRTMTSTGNAVECPCCGRSFRQFLPFGRPQRPNARCPRCGALERHRLLWLYLQRETELFSRPVKLLHVAPEEQFRGRFREMSQLEYVTGDLYDNRADVKLDIRETDFEDDTFGVIICNHVLEHIPEDEQAMRELHRVLKAGGWAILMVPQDFTRDVTFEDPSVTSPEERLRVFGQADHVRIYGKDYVERLKKAGFVVEEIAYADAISKEEVSRYGVMNDNVIYRCLKPAR